MSKMHLWAGNFKSRAHLEKYLDQKKYLQAWAKYNNEQPTGNGEEDGEPDTVLRCKFCKETGLDTYDEDFIAVLYYKNAVSNNSIAEDLCVDEGELAKLLKKNKLGDITSIITYQDNDLDKKSAAGTTMVLYLGTIARVTETHAEAGIHHLWVGENNLDKKVIRQTIGLEDSDILKINFHFSKKKQRLDEMIITHVDDFNIAEKMILKADEMKAPVECNAILDLYLNGNPKIDVDKIARFLGTTYIGRFEVE